MEDKARLQNGTRVCESSILEEYSWSNM